MGIKIIVFRFTFNKMLMYHLFKRTDFVMCFFILKFDMSHNTHLYLLKHLVFRGIFGWVTATTIVDVTRKGMEKGNPGKTVRPSLNPEGYIYFTPNHNYSKRPTVPKPTPGTNVSIVIYRPYPRNLEFDVARSTSPVSADQLLLTSDISCKATICYFFYATARRTFG